MKGGEIFWEGEYSSIINEDFFKEFSIKIKKDRTSSSEENSEDNKNKSDEGKNIEKSEKLEEIARITKDEEQLQGMVKFEVKHQYVKLNGGYRNFILIFLSI
jgi:hypothetical protein